MATSSKIHLSPSVRAVYQRSGITKESAAKASELLQENHEKHHIMYHDDSFHNHIAHHVLTLFALGASPDILQKQYDLNKTYQSPPKELKREIVDDMAEPAHFKKYVGDVQYYHDFLVFFQGEIDKKGWESVVQEYLFQGDERADDMLVRLYAGFLHPIIHLGFGIEFEQPAIIAESLAETAIHPNWIGPLFLESEKAAKAAGPSNKSLTALMEDARANEILFNSPHWEDGNKIRDGILVRAPQEMVQYASQWTVQPSQLDEKLAEMTNFAAYFSGAAQHPPKLIKYDFYYMHCLNCSIFYPAIMKQSWLSTENKIRLLEWKGRNDLTMYVSRRSPKLLRDEIIDYMPKQPSSGSDPWSGIFERVKHYEDDGHAPKLVRAIAHGEQVCRPYEKSDPFGIKGDMWLKLGNMAIDSVESPGARWVRSAGFDEAWADFEDRPRAQL